MQELEWSFGAAQCRLCGRGKIQNYISKNHRGGKKALCNYRGLARRCRKVVIFRARESCKSLCGMGLKIYGIL